MGYTIIKRAEHQFVVRSDDQDILTCSSRRKAAQFIAEANGLMHPDVEPTASETEPDDYSELSQAPQIAEIKE